jgi:hypothetical protein
MAVANAQTTTTLNDLVPVVTETSEGASNPAAVYLAGLAKTGRRAMAGQLRWVARVVGAESIDAVPWHLLRHEHLVAIRTKSEEAGRSCCWQPCSRMPQESQIESCKDQDDSYVHHQPFPEPMPEEQEIKSDYDGYHQHYIKPDNHLFLHSQPQVQI